VKTKNYHKFPKDFYGVKKIKSHCFFYSTVLRRCQEGDHRLGKLNQDANRDFDKKWESCKRMIGMQPITDESLQRMIDRESTKRGFNKVCEMNSQDRNVTVCNYKCGGGKFSKNTAMASDMDLSVEVVYIINLVNLIAHLR
jgi:hypothetical protein